MFEINGVSFLNEGEQDDAYKARKAKEEADRKKKEDDELNDMFERLPIPKLSSGFGSNDEAIVITSESSIFKRVAFLNEAICSKNENIDNKLRMQRNQKSIDRSNQKMREIQLQRRMKKHEELMKQQDREERKQNKK